MLRPIPEFNEELVSMKRSSSDDDLDRELRVQMQAGLEGITVRTASVYEPDFEPGTLDAGGRPRGCAAGVSMSD